MVGCDGFARRPMLAAAGYTLPHGGSQIKETTEHRTTRPQPRSARIVKAGGRLELRSPGRNKLLAVVNEANKLVIKCGDEYVLIDAGAFAQKDGAGH